MMNFIYANPSFFYLFALLPFLILWYWKYNGTQSEKINISTLEGFAGYRPSLRQRLRHFPFLLRLAGLSFLIVALARPQSSSSGQNIFSEGIDIVLAMDISGSMLAEDLKPNRIEAAKAVAIDFIKSRPNDRIGLVVFAGESFTQCPITSDHDVLINLFGSLKSGLMSDGTALGEGLATAVTRIKEGKAKNKVIILLTDGVNNVGMIAPVTAAEIAKTFGVRVYTIGVGTKGLAPYPFQTPQGVVYQNIEVDIDEVTMQKIASLTGGEYFRATNNKKLKSIYQEIDKLEKTKIEVTEYRSKTEEFFPFALLATLLLLAEIVLKYTVFKTLP
jgi:Ca-activated chloride channel family protein